MTWRTAACAFIVAGCVVAGCSSDEKSSDTTEGAAATTDEVTTTQAATTTAAPTTTAAATTTTEAPTTTEEATTTTTQPEADVEELVPVLVDLEKAIEVGDTDEAQRLGGDDGEARAWYRKLGALFPDNYPPTAEVEVECDLAVESDDGDVITTSGSCDLTYADGYETQHHDPTFGRRDGEIVVLDSGTARDGVFDLRTGASEPATSESGTEFEVRSAQMYVDPEAGISVADFIVTSDAGDEPTPLTAVWVDASGTERVTAFHVGTDDTTGLTVIGASFDGPFDGSVVDGLGTLNLIFADDDSVEIELPESLADVDGLALDALDPAPEDDPSLDEAAARQSITDVLVAYVDAASRCGTFPNQCNVTGPFAQNVVNAISADAQHNVDANISVRYPAAQVAFRIDDVRVSPSGLHAAVDTCHLDGAVQMDIGDPSDPNDDTVVDDEVLSSETLFTFAVIDGEWTMTGYGRTEMFDDPNECAQDTGAERIDVPQPQQPPEIDALGQIAFRETVVGFVENTVIAYGEQGVDPEALAQALLQTYPSISVDGSGIDATPTSISLYSNTVDDKSSPAADNPWVVAVAVMDTTGACLGGAVYGFPLPTTILRFDEPQPCNADAVFEAAVAQI
jgi:hypothetical protein